MFDIYFFPKNRIVFVMDWAMRKEILISKDKNFVNSNILSDLSF